MIEIKLYDRNLTSPTFVENITQKVQGLRFTTKLNGGFYLCSFRLMADLPSAWEWITKRVFYRLVITDGPQTLWEGRIEDLGLTQGAASVVAYGYYSNLSDIPYATAYDDNADVVLKAVLLAAATQINNESETWPHIDATDGPAITSAAATSYRDIYPKQIVEKLLAFYDDTNNDKWYFAIWEDRIPYLFARDDSVADWLVNIRDFARFDLRHRGAELWNSCYAIYTSNGDLTRTDTANDTTSQEKYGDGTTDLIRRKVIPQLGTVVAAAAQSARAGWIAEHKDIWPRLENMILGSTVYDINGVPTPSSWIRASDVIRVRDLVPASGALDAVERDALRTYYIVETVFDMDRNEMRIIPDTDISWLDRILGKTLKEGG